MNRTFRQARWEVNKFFEELRQVYRRWQAFKKEKRIYMIQYRNSLRAFKVLFRAGMRVTQTDLDGGTKDNRLRFHWNGKIMPHMADIDIIDDTFYIVNDGHSEKLS